MHPILFQIGNLTFYTHGVVAVLGIFSGSLLAYFLARRNHLEVTYFFDNIVFTVLFGIIGARLAYFILYYDQFSKFTDLFKLWEGGLVSYGGIIFGALTFYLLSKAQKQPRAKWLDVMSIGFFLGFCLGRIGEIFAGEWAGVYSDSKILTLNYLSPVIPIPFYEAVLCLLIAVAGLLVFLKIGDKLKSGLIFWGSIAAYSLVRFFIDFWRDDTYLFLNISFGQFFGALVFLLSTYMFMKIIKSRNNNG